MLWFAPDVGHRRAQRGNQHSTTPPLPGRRRRRGQSSARVCVEEGDALPVRVTVPCSRRSTRPVGFAIETCHQGHRASEHEGHRALGGDKQDYHGARQSKLDRSTPLPPASEWPPTRRLPGLFSGRPRAIHSRLVSAAFFSLPGWRFQKGKGKKLKSANLRGPISQSHETPLAAICGNAVALLVAQRVALIQEKTETLTCSAAASLARDLRVVQSGV